MTSIFEGLFPQNKAQTQTKTRVIKGFHPKDHWTLKTGYFEDPTPAIQVQTLPLEGPRSLGQVYIYIYMTDNSSHTTSFPAGSVLISSLAPRHPRGGEFVVNLPGTLIRHLFVGC